MACKILDGVKIQRVDPGKSTLKSRGRRMAEQHATNVANLVASDAVLFGMKGKDVIRLGKMKCSLYNQMNGLNW